MTRSTAATASTSCAGLSVLLERCRLNGGERGHRIDITKGMIILNVGGCSAAEDARTTSDGIKRPKRRTHAASSAPDEHRYADAST